MSGPASLFADPERVTLIGKLSQALSGIIRSNDKATFETVRACLWLADIEQLRHLEGKYLPDFATEMESYFEAISVRDIVAKWTQSDKSSSSKSSSVAPSPSQPHTSSEAAISPRTPQSARSLESGKEKKPRSAAVTENCWDRDASCVVTQSNLCFCEAAHLYPYSMQNRNENGVRLFWDTLRVFWTKEHVDQWSDAIFRNDHLCSERVENLLCLSCDAHSLHTLGHFALEPLTRDTDGRSLTVRFWWLKKDPRDKTIDIAVIPQLPADYDPCDIGIGLHNPCSKRPLRSGDTITLSTQNPTEHPLPDMRLLEMQWILGRVTAISGAGEADNLECDDSDYDDCSDYQCLNAIDHVDSEHFQ